MPIADSILPEFDHEMSNTRKTLERVPDDKFAWKPHEKSMTLGRLSGHLAEMPGWGIYTLSSESMDLAPVDGPPVQSPQPKNRQEVLALFDKGVAEMRAALAAAKDDQLLKPWSLLAGGKPIFTMPRIAVIRGMILNHGIHHRAQLGVYLRLNNLPVPALYGPSADEGKP
jgi:uncharacterized damage-inducible protein DinB